MSRIRIRTLERLKRKDVRRLVPGYVSDEIFVPQRKPAKGQMGVRMERIPRPRPFRKRYPVPPQEWEMYRSFLRHGVSLGAYEGVRLVGLALVEARTADRVLWIWEFGVLEPYRRQGTGTALLRELERRAERAGFVSLGLETQTTNVPAVDFYRRNGFRVDRVDLDFYPSRLADRGEFAVFMSKRVRPPHPQRRSTRRYQERSRG